VSIIENITICLAIHKKGCGNRADHCKCSLRGVLIVINAVISLARCGNHDQLLYEFSLTIIVQTQSSKSGESHLLFE